MKKLALALLTACLPLMGSIPNLPNEYLVTYGDPEAPVHVVEYYAIGCKVCSQLFHRQFDEVRRKYIDTGHVYWTMHPVPANPATILSLGCLRLLDPAEKRIFLEVVLSAPEEWRHFLEDQGLEDLNRQENPFSSGDYFEELEMEMLMLDCMEQLDVSPPDITDREAFKENPAYDDALAFVLENSEQQQALALSLNAIPAITIQGQFFDQIPNHRFLAKHLDPLIEQITLEESCAMS